MDSSNGRVLHVIDVLSPGSGVANVVRDLVVGIPQFKQDVAVYGQCDDEMEREITSCGGRVYQLPNVTQSFGFHFGKAFAQLIKDNSYGIVHGHLLNSAFIYLRAAKLHGVPCRIIHAHSAASSDSQLKRMRNDILSLGIPIWANNYIAVSQAAAKRAFGGKNKNISIIQNGIDVNRFCYNSKVRFEVRKELGLKDSVICVGNVARFDGLKNHSFILKVFQEMRKKADCALVLVGRGYLENDIKEMADALSLKDSVYFLGLRSDVERVYQAFDVFLLPSLHEGFGLAAVEAQCAGLGCVVSENVPMDTKCSDHIQYLPLGDAKHWADVALEMNNKTRSDGSKGVVAAKLDNIHMCGKVFEIYNSKP